MMRQMREKTKIIMLVTAAAFVLLMVMEDFDFLTGGGTAAELRGGDVGRVNGDAITFEQFNSVYRDLFAERQQQSPEPITSAEIRELEDAAWEQVVSQRLIAQELNRRGIGVTVQEIRAAARTSPPPEFIQNELFHTDGQFDLTKYHQFLASPAIDNQLLLQLEAYYRDVIPRTKLLQQVASGVYITDAELWRDWRDQHERVAVRYLSVDPTMAVPDAGVSVSDDEVRDFYNRYRDDFQRAARASVRHVLLDKAPTAADTTAARERALEIRREIIDGADFGEVARRESADRGSAERGGDLGTFTRGQMVPVFEEAVWSQPIGQVGEPVLSQFGYHLIRVDSREGDQASARHILIPVELTRESEDALLSRADSLEMLIRTRSLDEAAEEIGARARTIDVTREIPSLPGIGRIDDGLDWIFDDRPEPGEISPLFETRQAFYMLELIERQDARRLTLEEATPMIRSRLLQQKKLERARSLARDLHDRVARGEGMDELAASYDGVETRTVGPFSRVDFVPGLGFANAAVGAAFGLQPGDLSGVVEADDRFFLLEVIDREDADREAWEEQKESHRRTVQAMAQQERINQFLQSLRENARIVDNREQVLRREL